MISKNTDGFFQVLIMEMCLLEMKDLYMLGGKVFVSRVGQETFFKHEQEH